ncbi:MAG: haloalkane dehalogenase [Paracoccaceae bacterium]|jgi:haloalkane dehalogenase|nr:haloalkane dehalogenase [Paracoccaceae bacterium]
MPISAAKPEKKFIEVNGRQMAYVEMGSGDPIVFQHGNPTSSYLWRNIMPHVADQGRCIAVDLIGMGDSDKLPDNGPYRYTFAEHREFLHAVWEQLGVTQDVTLVIHDWGSALGFDWARQNAEKVKGICYMEAVVGPVPSWDDWPENARNIFQALRSPAGEDLILEKNIFVERILTSSIMRTLSDEEMNEYRRPFAEAGEGRRPTLTWPRQIPVAGEPADVVQIATDYAKWMASNDIPKLFIDAQPGSILTGKARGFALSFQNQTVSTAKGLHFLQEDSPDEIGVALSNWLKSL